MGGYSIFHWVIVAALLVYLWFLVKIAKPKPITKPIKSSKAWLIAQTVTAWLCTLFFGVLTLGILAMKGTQQTQPLQPGDVAGLTVDLTFALGVPLLLAFSVRWARSSMRKWEAVRSMLVESSNAGD